MEKVEKDLLIAKAMLGIESSKENFDIDVYGSVYPWSNEDIRSYYNYVDLNRKSTLSITSSGDHIIYACLAGSRLIDGIDINPFAKYYSALKIAMMSTYDLKEIKKHLKIKKYKRFKVLSLNRIDIKELKSCLTDEEIYFWSSLIKKKKINDAFFRYDGFIGGSNMPYYIINKELYNKFQENIMNCKIKYYDIDLSEKNIELPNMYDCIYLSNVLEHTYTDEDKSNIINNCKDALNQDGKIITYKLNNCANSFLRRYDDTETIGNAKVLSF